LSAATTDGLEENAVGGVTFGDEGAIGVEINARGGTTVATGTAKGEGSGEISA